MSVAEPTGHLASAYVAADRLPDQLWVGDVDAARETLAEIQSELDAMEGEDGHE